MTHLINKDAIVSEIEKRKREAESNCGGYKSYDEHRCDACIVGFYEEFLEIINTIEVKDGFTPLDSDFERDAVSFCIDKGLNTTPYIAKTIAKHFFNLGLKYNNTENDAQEI